MSAVFKTLSLSGLTPAQVISDIEEIAAREISPEILKKAVSAGGAEKDEPGETAQSDALGQCPFEAIDQGQGSDLADQILIGIAINFISAFGIGTAQYLWKEVIWPKLQAKRGPAVEEAESPDAEPD